MSYRDFSSIPDYNKFRFTATSVDRNNFVAYAVKLPVDMRPLFFGAFSVLLDFNSWVGTDFVSAETMTEIANNDICWSEFCEFVADCIASNIQTQQALADAIATSSTIQNAIQQVVRGGMGANSIIDNTVFSGSSLVVGDVVSGDCTDDYRYGRVSTLVDYLDTITVDFFQSLDAATTVIGEASDLISAIPVLETLPIDEVVDVLADTGEQWLDSYLASVSQPLLDGFKQELFCAYPDCVITVKDVRQFLEQRYNLVTTTGILNVLSMAGLIAKQAGTILQAGGATYVGDDLVFLSWLIQISAVETTGQFFGTEIIDYANQTANAAPDSSWQNCPSSVLGVVTFSATGYNNYTFLPDTSTDTTTGNPPASAICTPAGTGFSGGVLVDLVVDRTVDSVSFDFRWNYSNPLVNNPYREVQLLDEFSNVLDTGAVINVRSENTWHTQVFTFSSVSSVRFVRVFIGRSTGQSGNTGTGWIDNIDVGVV